MKKVIFIFCILFFLSSIALSNDINWKIGDYWKYQITDFRGNQRSYIEEIKVIGKEMISFYGKNYYAYKVEIKRLNQTLFGFYRVSDLADIGMRYDENYSIISDPPLEKYKFLEIGKKWNQSVVSIQNIGGKLHNISFIVYYECLGKEKIKTKAGKFECYKIKSYSNDSDEYSIEFFSPSIKNKVLFISYKNGEIISRGELIETSYNKDHKIPLFTFPLLIFSFGYILLIKKLKRRKDSYPFMPNHHR